ncbi:MAG TPA: hypothetical protein VKY40_07200, partial [Halanaerobiales bacterium]|nr:hypothetical protein [Halanaerobiales bacterium]
NKRFYFTTMFYVPHDDKNVSEVLLMVTNPDGTAVVDARSVAPGSGKTEEVDLSGLGNIEEGYYSVTVKITDEADNMSLHSNSYAFLVDNTIDTAVINSLTDTTPAVVQ